MLLFVLLLVKQPKGIPDARAAASSPLVLPMQPTGGPYLQAGVRASSNILAFTLYLSTAARTITTHYGGVDGGELAATALSGGVPHPPAYPTYMLLARAALLLPFGEAAGYLVLRSALFAILIISLRWALVTQYHRIELSDDTTERS